VLTGFGQHPRLHRFVMPGLVPGIHVFRLMRRKTWMAGSSPAMTAELKGEAMIAAKEKYQ
jgi:hypothetical protein